VIRFLRRRRRPAPLIPPPPPREPVVRTGVVIVDGTPHDVAPALRAALLPTGLPTEVIDPGDLDTGADVVVLLLPVRSRRPLSPTATDALSLLGGFAATPGTSFRSRIVVAWHLRAEARRELSAPRTDGRLWNAGDLLLGTSWSRELAHHRGDEPEAVRCRSGRVERMVTSPTHHRLGLTVAGEVLRTLRALDPHLLHTLCVEVPDHSATPTLTWTGAPAVAATVRTRLAAP